VPFLPHAVLGNSEIKSFVKNFKVLVEDSKIVMYCLQFATARKILTAVGNVSLNLLRS